MQTLLLLLVVVVVVLLLLQVDIGAMQVDYGSLVWQQKVRIN
jgi:hypothetical protein